MEIEALSSISLDVTRESGLANVEPHDVARLMYYLDCVSKSGLVTARESPKYSKPPRKLTNHANYHLLDFADVRSLVGWCEALGPGQPTIDQHAFCDLAKEVFEDLTKVDCAFLSSSVNCDVSALRGNVMLIQSVKWIGDEVMTQTLWTPPWEKMFYTDPFQNISIYHCLHFDGKDFEACNCREEPLSHSPIERTPRVVRWLQGPAVHRRHSI